jgi:hypothetical protein
VDGAARELAPGLLLDALVLPGNDVQVRPAVDLVPADQGVVLAGEFVQVLRDDRWRHVVVEWEQRALDEPRVGLAVAVVVAVRPEAGECPPGVAAPAGEGLGGERLRLDRADARHYATSRWLVGVPVVREGAREVLSGIAVTSLPVRSELAVALAYREKASGVGSVPAPSAFSDAEVPLGTVSLWFASSPVTRRVAA